MPEYFVKSYRITDYRRRFSRIFRHTLQTELSEPEKDPSTVNVPESSVLMIPHGIILFLEEIWYLDRLFFYLARRSPGRVQRRSSRPSYRTSRHGSCSASFRRTHSVIKPSPCLPAWLERPLIHGTTHIHSAVSNG